MGDIEEYDKHAICRRLDEIASQIAPFEREIRGAQDISELHPDKFNELTSLIEEQAELTNKLYDIY